jgi:hypothetical protein
MSQPPDVNAVLLGQQGRILLVQERGLVSRKSVIALRLPPLRMSKEARVKDTSSTVPYMAGRGCWHPAPVYFKFIFAIICCMLPVCHALFRHCHMCFLTSDTLSYLTLISGFCDKHCFLITEEVRE